MTQKHRNQARPPLGLMSFGSLGRIAWLLGVVVFCLGLLGPVHRAMGQCQANELAKLTGSHGGADWFGYSLSIDGDAVLIGAPGHDHSGLDAGSAFVYRLDGANWIEEAELIASDATEGHYFGYAVSIGGDRAVIGAIGDGEVGSFSGSAYVFRFESGQWGEEAKLTASDAAGGDNFGWSVDVSGDVAVIGAPGDDDAGSHSGSAYLFRFDPETAEWNEEKKLTASDAAGGDEFGCSVSIDGDWAAVGAWGHADDGPQWGSAYVFRRSQGGPDNWGQVAKLTAPDAAQTVDFGWSVSLDHDAIVIGAPSRSKWSPQPGSAYVFRLDSGEWIEEAELTVSDGALDDWFAYSVSISDDVVVIGVPKSFWSGIPNGWAYVFRFDGTQWIEEAKLIPSDTAPYDLFGVSASIMGDRAVIARDLGGGGAGSAYVFGALGDCNENGMLDACDIADGTSQDENGNGVPDECEMPGDLNCDRVVDTLDIDPFALALIDPAAYTAEYPDCDINHADTNADGALNAADIQSFVHLLVP